MWDNLEVKKQEAPDTQDNPQISEDFSEKEKRYKEQLAWSKSEAERLRQLIVEAEVQKASQNANSLLELHSKDPKLANEVAKEFWYESFDDAKKQITTEDESKQSNKWLTEDEFEKWYQQRKSKEEHEKALKKAENLIAKLDEQKQEKAKAFFDKIAGGKTLDEETAIEFAEMATLYVNKDKLKWEKYQEWIAMLWSTWLWNSKKASDDKPREVVRDGKLVLLSNN